MSSQITFHAPPTQTCEVYLMGSFLRTEERPVPLILGQTDQTGRNLYPYTDSPRVFLLPGTIKLWKFMNLIKEEHPDGVVYVWWNPDHLFHGTLSGGGCGCIQENEGAYMRQFPSGSFEGRFEGVEHTWSVPVERDYVPPPIVDEYEFLGLDEKGNLITSSVTIPGETIEERIQNDILADLPAEEEDLEEEDPEEEDNCEQCWRRERAMYNEEEEGEEECGHPGIFRKIVKRDRDYDGY